MRYSVEHQRNIAYELLELKRRGIEFSSYFKSGEPIIIYGFDFLGREIYHEIKDKVNVVCFVDRAHDKERYEGVPVFSLDNDEIILKTQEYSEVKFLNAIVSDTDKIVEDTIARIKNARYVSLYQIFAWHKVKNNQDFIEEQNAETLVLLNQILENRNTEISNIILVGTSYTELLAMLYLKDWSTSLFIMERYVSESIVQKMKDKGLYCLYEKHPVDYYAICYIIAEHAKTRNIPVWGHDHMQLSRAFLLNGINVLEDGLGNYDYKYAQRYPIFLDGGRYYASLGYDELVKKVVLTGQFDVPKELVDKAEIITPSLLWSEKTEQEKINISDIMGFDYENIHSQVISGRSIVFLTEPNIAAGKMLMTVEEQINLYKKILSNYKEVEIIIKPHPADSIDYSLSFENCFIIDRRFPIQLMDWLGLKVSKFIVMKGSSCINIFKGKYKVDIYDKDILIEEW